MAKAADAAFMAAQAAEIGLAIAPDGSNIAERLSTGSFYTPSDVVDHFWREYADFHALDDIQSWRVHLRAHHFVEPSVGAGVFLFGLLSHLVHRGAAGEDLEALTLTAIDLNGAALAFIRHRLHRLEAEMGVRLSGVRCHQGDFLSFKSAPGLRLSFIGNPPYVRNAARARWRNLYADFIEGMLDAPAQSRALSLIVPLSVAFSRDYAPLRRRINGMAGLRLEAFDNIPDCLFPAGKPGHGNTNKANSQRCVILSAREAGPRIRQATELRRWSRHDRERVLAGRPNYVDFDAYNFDDQWPRPSADWTISYLSNHGQVRTISDLCGPGQFALGVASVARNYIGLREVGAGDDPSVTRLTFPNSQAFATALQILASSLFYEGWRTTGDGFHVTRSDILDFPVPSSVEALCQAGAGRALALWQGRTAFERIKMNAGRPIRSYDFRGEFDALLEAASNPERQSREAA